MNFAGCTGSVAVNLWVGNEHSEYVRIASVGERNISKTSLDASKIAEKQWLYQCRTDVSRSFFIRKRLN